ncbi:MAG: hypothetical protein WCY92_02315 [Novosphingobium sp.]|uniref:hypothetical protein n=1 Tax=Tsuneonella sp. CC-YZS046 TaxID=3042152 RepID=UPI002D79A728|nr:hypothetical protein [Tsuneonella sp. CC-YZS046]WRO65622.1 hypothetical protein U8326_11235 [Tsuneonella sp. CC-YZS046]
MIPEIDVQLAAVAKSLADNVLPAVDPANAMAVEQLHLALATLAIVRQRLPDLHAYLRRDLADNIALARQIGANADTIADSEAVLASPESSPQRIEAQVRALKEAIGAAIDEARGTPAEAAVAAAVLAAQGPMILRMRAWAIGMGFEPDPSQIPDLTELLEDKQP